MILITGRQFQALFSSSVGTVHIILHYSRFKTDNMYRSYGTQKKSVRFFGGLKSAATILTEPTALLGAENLWVMDRVLNLRQVIRPKTNVNILL